MSGHILFLHRECQPNKYNWLTIQEFYDMLLQVHLCNTTRDPGTAAAVPEGMKGAENDAHVQEKGSVSDLKNTPEI